jgi:hypothetical protein
MKKRNNFKIDFIGIGAQRCATTWISQCLKEHPQICFSLKKEVDFFTREEKDLKYYKSFFDHCLNKKVRGEFSPQYMHPEYVSVEKTAQRIKKNFPDVKLMVCLRNPIERAYSQYFLEKSPGEKPSLPPTFEEAISKNFHNCVKAGFYYTLLKPYLDLFPRKNILILIYEDIKKDPLKFIQSIYSFLEIDSNFNPPSLNKNFAFPPRQKFIFRFADKLSKYSKKYYLIRVIVGMLKLIKINSLINFWRKKEKDLTMPLTRPSTSRPPMKLKTRKYLQQIYKDEIKNLEKLINRDLSFWK